MKIGEMAMATIILAALAFFLLFFWWMLIVIWMVFRIAVWKNENRIRRERLDVSRTI